MKIRMLFSAASNWGTGTAVLLWSAFSLWGAVPGDEHWDAQFGVPGVSNTIYAVVTHNGLVYAAGAVPAGVGGTNTPLYVWDGAKWSVAAEFYGPVFNGPSLMQVNDLAFVGETLYAAGSFTNVNGVAANGLAKWDGATWSGVGFTGLAYGLAADGNKLYVVGLYTNATPAVTNIGYWDGNAWHALGDGLGLVGNLSYVRTVTVKNGQVYAGGSFTNSGSQLITNLAVWNGATWSAMAGGGVNGQVNALAFNNNDLYVGGAFTQAGATPANSIAKWDGANWSALGSGLTGGSSAAVSIAILNGVICVVGSFTNAGGITASNVALWNGSSWSGAAGALSATGYRVVADGSQLYAGGAFTSVNNVWANGMAIWDGTRWTGMGSPGRLNGVQTTVTALAFDGTNLYAGGLFTLIGRTNAVFIARFDGNNWYPLGTGLGPATGAAINAIALYGNNVYVGGTFSTAGGVAVQNIARWDGTNWYSMGNPVGGGIVYSLTARADGVYAVGAAHGLSGYGSPYFSRWDGTNWQGVLVYNPNDTFSQFFINDTVPGMNAAALQGSNCYVGGHFNITWHDPTLTFFTNCPNILHFDGTFVRIMGTGFSSTLVALAASDSNVFAAGPFTMAGDVPANQLARWDGNTWSSVGGSVVGNGTVLALATAGNSLYAGGSFTNLGGVPVNRIAKWDGTNWSALGSGTSGSVVSLASLGSTVYAGGSLSRAGGKISNRIGRWNELANFNIPQLTNPARLTNNQFRVRLMGVSDLTNIIQASTNFVSWTPVLTNSAGIYDFTDSNSTAYPWRFYRALLGP